jgi:hypothetical protein
MKVGYFGAALGMVTTRKASSAKIDDTVDLKGSHDIGDG